MHRTHGVQILVRICHGLLQIVNTISLFTELGVIKLASWYKWMVIILGEGSPQNYCS